MKSASKDRRFVSQQRLAAELGVTDRRVRQLIGACILACTSEGLYDLPACRERFELFKSPRDLEAWSDYLADLEKDALETERLLNAALDPASTPTQVRNASQAVQAHFSALRFLTAARSQTDAERKLFWTLWSEKEDDALRRLIGRASEIFRQTAAM